jgi:hypothetical protein
MLRNRVAVQHLACEELWELMREYVALLENEKRKVSIEKS